MKITPLILSVALVALPSATTAQTFEWAKQFGSTDADRSTSIAVDAAGNVYTTGYFEGTVDFDPGGGTFEITSAGETDCFISKLDAAGNFVWAKQLGGTSWDQAWGITTDGSGNVYTTGSFQGTADFDPGEATFDLTTDVSPAVFISKLDAAGNFVWAKQISGSSNVESFSIDLDALGNVYTTGRYAGTIDFDPGIGTFNLSWAGSQDMFISKLDNDGNFVWAAGMGGENYDDAFSITTDLFGNVYTTGRFLNTLDFDPGAGTFNLTSNGGDDIYISKLDASGNFLWAKSIGGEYSEGSNSITTDAAGNVYTTGSFSLTVDFDPGVGTTELSVDEGADSYILKLDADGNFVWAKQISGPATQVGLSIAVDANGNVYTTGYFVSTADFDPGDGTMNLTSAGGNDVYISKLDNDGNFVWAKQVGGKSSDRGHAIAVDASGNVFTTGIFEETADFDPEAGTYNLTSTGQTDVFIHKLASTTTGISENSFPYPFSYYPNPTRGEFTIDMGLEVFDGTVVIRNLVGQETMRHRYISSTPLTLYLQGEAGVYIVELTSGDRRAVFKMMK